MAVTLTSLCRDYGYLDTDTEQTRILDLCLGAAVQYLYNADIRPPKPEEDEDPLYDLMVLMLTTHWYDCRGVMPIGSQLTGQFALGINANVVTHGKNVGPEDTLASALAYARGGESK